MKVPNNKNIATLVTLTLILLMTAGCSVFRQRDYDKEELLLNHLRSWEDFRLEGIAELSYGQIRFRRNVNISMNKQSLNLTLFDGGIFGLKPKPLFSLRIDEALYLEASDALATLLDDDDVLNLPSVNIYDIHKGLVHLQRNSGTIVRSGQITLQGAIISFSDMMQINEIIIRGTTDKPDRELRLIMEYGREGILARVTVEQESSRIITINVDRMIFAPA